MFRKLLIINIMLLLVSCSSYTSTLVNEDAVFDGQTKLKKGIACSKNLFGGVKIPYINNPVIKLSGSESIETAIINGNIRQIAIIDKETKHYLVYSKRCVIVHGN